MSGWEIREATLSRENMSVSIPTKTKNFGNFRKCDIFIKNNIKLLFIDSIKSARYMTQLE